MREILIRENDGGQRLDRFLRKALPALPGPLAQKYLRRGRIKLNGRAAKGDARIFPGDRLSLYIEDEFFAPSARRDADTGPLPEPDIVYEDQNLLILSKEPGLLCHDAKNAGADTLIARVLAYTRKNKSWSPEDSASFAPALCNRIDRNTGGLVIAAKNAPALRMINEKIRERQLHRAYLCAVHGDIRPEAGVLEGYLLKGEKSNRVSLSPHPAGGAKYVRASYQTLARAPGLALLECRLHTGRSHQIRAQLALRGHPLLGDRKYGDPALNRRFTERYQALWAYKLGFAFTTDAGALNYLQGREFTAGRVPFAEKYFGFSMSDRL